MSAVDRLKAAATRLRAVIQTTDLTECGCSLANFPTGCCHHGTKLLAWYLFEQGWDGLRVAVGKRGVGLDNEHVWLQWGDVILDITADQFGEGLGPVIVTDCSPWHDAWAPQFESIKGDRIKAWKESDLSVHQAYRLILSGMDE